MSHTLWLQSMYGERFIMLSYQYARALILTKDPSTRHFRQSHVTICAARAPGHLPRECSYLGPQRIGDICQALSHPHGPKNIISLELIGVCLASQHMFLTFFLHAIKHAIKDHTCRGV